jgi:serine/threonine-protein kinase RsbT
MLYCRRALVIPPAFYHRGLAVNCTITREVDIYVAMSRARELAEVCGFRSSDRSRIEIAILELTRNLLAHAGGGTICIARVEDPSRGAGIAITATDRGPGIPDVELALQDGFSTAHTLGAGLPGVRRLMDEFAISSQVGVGTEVRAVKWAAPARRGAHHGL